jgi:phage-related protein
MICTHGITKKKQKTPQKEIDKAEQLRKKYLEL